MSDSGRSSSQILASLQARKDTLEAKLHDKTQELKSLCIKEAELTGFLPPEIPLEPGESPPQFRRRVGTAFSYPENLINNNNLKTKEEETLAAFELEYKIQRDIADAALGMANDPSLSKAVRRKHRQVYQKIQRRLADLEVKFHHLQQSLGHNIKPQQFKQRKKPRPPLDNDLDNQEHDPILHDEGISLSPVGPVNQELELDNVGRFCDIGPGQQLHHEAVRFLPGGIWHSASYNGLSAPVSQESMGMYNRHGTPGYHHHHHHHLQHHNQHYSTLPTAVELGYMVQRERLDQGRSIPGYWLRYETDLENYTTLSKPVHHIYQPLLEVDHQELKDVAQHSIPNNSDATSLHNHVHSERDRFGSLDRAYTRTNSHSSSSPCLEAYGVEDLNAQMHKLAPPGANGNYYSAATPLLVGLEQGVDTRRMYMMHHTPAASRPHGGGGGGALLPNQTYPEHSLGVSNQGLTRTQSLGSVETTASISQSHTSGNSDVRSVKEQQRFAPPSDTLIRKQKEKEWYETSLDSAPCSVPCAAVMSSMACVTSQLSCPPSRRPSGHSLSEMKIMSTVQDMPVIHQKNDPIVSDPIPNDRFSDVSSDLSRSSSNISGEQHANYPTLQAKIQETALPENFDTVVPFESPKNHMVVQAGKWQPYREVTKPFEMADFYKYSTKFRKHAANVHTAQRSGQPAANSSAAVENIYHTSAQHSSVYGQPKTSSNGGSPTPQQKGIYQPLQPMTCQPIDMSSSAAQNRGRNTTAEVCGTTTDVKRVAPSGKSLADAFSTEMLEWYQDQSVPRSATLV